MPYSTHGLCADDVTSLLNVVAANVHLKVAAIYGSPQLEVVYVESPSDGGDQTPLFVTLHNCLRWRSCANLFYLHM